MRRLLLIGFGIALPLLISEIIVRGFGLAPAAIVLASTSKGSAYRRSANPILGYELTPSFRAPEPTNEFGSFSYVNSDGHRDVERSVARIPGRKRLIMLGDSVVAGHGVTDLEDTISRNLERLFGDGTEVLNFGVGGYNTLGEAELLRTSGLKYRPDAVLLVCLDNDDESANGDLPSAAALTMPAWTEPFFLHSDLFRFIAQRVNFFGYNNALDELRMHEKVMGSDTMTRGFRELDHIARRRGIRVGVALWPSFLSDRVTDEFYPKSSDGKRTLPEELAAFYRMPLVRLSSAFDEECRRRPSCVSPRQTFTVRGDMIHPTADAAQVAAAALKPLAELLLRERSLEEAE